MSISGATLLAGAMRPLAIANGTGHSGWVNTIHASSAKAALSRRRVESYAAREGFRLEAP